MGLIKGGTRSLDYSLNDDQHHGSRFLAFPWYVNSLQADLKMKT